ncbi:MAG: hypothetical protein O7D27_01980, partial [Alphaproteobacteria bacterium]|nr:hypothetical protein [Alphaproteobacteria bacterium]
VPTQSFSNLIDENVAYFERIERELPWAKMSLTLPILVMGVEPSEWTDVHQCYDRAASTYIAHMVANGKRVEEIPFASRLVEDTPEDTD